LLGRIVGIFGVRGEMKIAATGIGEDALRSGLRVALRFDDERSERILQIGLARPHKRGMVASFDGILSPSDAETLVGASLWTGREDAALGAGEFFDEDLIGCRLRDSGAAVGDVVAVRHYPAQDVLELDNGALVPMVGAFIKRVDVDRRTIDVELPPGLIDGEPL